MRYSKGIRHEVLVKYLCGYTPKEIAEESGIHFVTIYRWISDWERDLECHPLTALPLQDVGMILTHTEKLKQRLEDAERSLTIIHTSGILQTIPLRQRIDMILPLIDSYPAKFLSQTFEVSLSAIYYHKGQGRRKVKRQQQDEDISSKIQEVFKESGGRFGAERIQIQLHNRGIFASKRKIIKLMRQMGLTSNTCTDTYYLSQSQKEESDDVQIL